ncbi:copper/silver efflux system outer membrane protein CusC [Kluyvera cryocrescens]|uniref:Copper/silver efflux system outer membrane protein CusC n=1 Tax=Kluyvera cryocrescens TaxID=580 RepID=A0A485AJ88_KLUCR|nr:copper/silver efflux system outer membrane protein CusC [Kluyvera cryocrescens]
MLTLKPLTLMMAFILAGCTSLAPDYRPPEKVVPEQFSLSPGRAGADRQPMARDRLANLFR